MIYSADFHELNVKTIVIFTESGKMGLSHFVTALFAAIHPEEAAGGIFYRYIKEVNALHYLPNITHTT